jgi:protein-lysine N-methyltransferase EEF2KMT
MNNNGWELVAQHFREQMPVNMLLKLMSEVSFTNTVDDWRSYSQQMMFLKHVYLEPRSQKFPTSPKYSLQVLRMYTEAVDSCGVEDIADELYEHIAKLHAIADDSNGHISFDLPIVAVTAACGQLSESKQQLELQTQSYATIGLKVNPHHNEVGLRMWESGYLLTEFLLAHPSISKNKTILELGAGLGLTGIVASRCCGASTTVLTDCAMDVLDNLRQTCSMNDMKVTEGAAAATVISKNNVIKVEYLDWLNGGDAAKESIGSFVDVILAADVLYDPFVVPHFVNILESLLLQTFSPQCIAEEEEEEEDPCSTSASPPSTSSPIALVAATLRNPSTLALFFQEVKGRNIPCFEYNFCPIIEKSGHVNEHDNDGAEEGNTSGSWLNKFIFNYNPGAVRLFALGWITNHEIFQQEDDLPSRWQPLSDDPMHTLKSEKP